MNNDEQMKIEEQTERFGDRPIVEPRIRQNNAGPRSNWKSYFGAVVLGAVLAFGGKAVLDNQVQAPASNQGFAVSLVDGKAFHNGAEVEITDKDWGLFLDYSIAMHKALSTHRLFENDKAKMEQMAKLYNEGKAPAFVDEKLLEIEDILDREYNEGKPTSGRPPLVVRPQFKPSSGTKIIKQDWEFFIDFYAKTRHTMMSYPLTSEQEIKMELMTNLYENGLAPDHVKVKLQESIESQNIQSSSVPDVDKGEWSNETSTAGAPKRTGLLDRMRDNKLNRQQQRRGPMD